MGWKPSSTSSRAGERWLVWFDRVLQVATVLLGIATVAAVPLLVLVVLGNGSLTVQAEADPPYAVVFGDAEGMIRPDQEYVAVDGGRATTHGNAVEGQEARFISEPPTVRMDIAIPTDDRTSRIVAIGAVVAFLTLAWIAVRNLGGIARSARAGNAFDGTNPSRFRWLALAVIAFPAVEGAFVRVVEHTLETSPPVTVVGWGPSWWVCLGAAIGLLALGEIFRVGTSLDEMDRATI